MLYATKALAVASALLMGAPTAFADTISGTDFETGDTSGWNTGTQTGTLDSTITGQGTGVSVVDNPVIFNADSFPAVGSPTLQDGSPNPYHAPAVTPTTWEFAPYGTAGAALQPNGQQTFNQATEALGLTPEQNQAIKDLLIQQQQASGLGNPNPTDAAWITKSVTLETGKIYTMSWNYIGTDYVPFNDGSITSLVYQGAGSSPSITVNNQLQNYALLGFTNPGTGDYSTGSFGSTGWQYSTYQVGANGDYLLGFAVFNLGDTALSPVLLVDSQPGTTTANGETFTPVAPNNPDAPSVDEVAPTPEPTPQPQSPTLLNSVTVPAPGLPVVVTTEVTHKASEKDGVQKIRRDFATTTQTPLLKQDTYSDGTVVSSLLLSVDTQNTHDVLSGRTDQYEVLDKIGGGLQNLLIHEPSKPTTDKVRVFSNNYYAWSSGDYGYSGKTLIIGGGLEIDIKPTWTIGGQYNNMNIDLGGVDSTSKLLKSHFGIFNMFRGNTFSLLTNAGYSQNKYNVSRNVQGVFNNESSTEGKEWFVNNRLFWHLNKNVRPFVGYTVGNYQRDGFTESGSVQSRRTVDAINKTSHSGEVGLNISHRFGGKKKDLFGVTVGGSYQTSGLIEASASVDYKEMVVIEGIHQINDGVSNTAVSAKLKFKF